MLHKAPFLCKNPDMYAPPSVLVGSEIGRLRKVMVHAPGPEWDLVPCGPNVLVEEFLIEDILVLPVAVEEHHRLTRTLGLFIGAENVLEFEELLAEVCAEDATRQEIVGAVSALDSLGLELSRALLNLDPRELAPVLICGALSTQGPRSSYTNRFRPIPNLLFTRDLGAAVPGGFVISHAAKKARRRETLLMRFVLRSHPFEGATILDVRGFENLIFWNEIRAKGPVSIEGGDLIVLNEKTLMVGTGERTTEAALYFLLQLLINANSSVQTVIRVILPPGRDTMHLDTVFTVMSKNEFMVYSPVIEKEARFVVYKSPFDFENQEGPLSFEEARRIAKLGDVKLVECGDKNELFQSREQWTDGANLFAIAPGILIGYNRNPETQQALEAREPSYRYLDAVRDEREIVRAAESFRNGNVEQRILIGLPGSELSRARGGPRCMTMPLVRDSL